MGCLSHKVWARTIGACFFSILFFLLLLCLAACIGRTEKRQLAVMDQETCEALATQQGQSAQEIHTIKERCLQEMAKTHWREDES